MLKILPPALIAAAIAGPALAQEISAAPIEAAERAFAADGLALGIRGSFLKHMADDAIAFAPGPVSARELYEKRPGTNEPRLFWWPQKVVIARSGDLGLSFGPWSIDDKRGGYYATIWRKGADGVWKWVYDGGAEADPGKAPGPDAAAQVGPPAPEGAASQAQGFEAARDAEAALAAAASTDAPAAYRAVLTADAWLLGPKGSKTLAGNDLSARLALRAASIALRPQGGGASGAGDLVWTHGEATWSGPDNKPVAAHYMHVWQKRAEGWRLIFETLINDT